METKISFSKKLIKYLLLLISNFTFFIAALLSFSYFHDLLRAFVWQKSFGLLLSVLVISVILWIITAIGYLVME